MCTFHNNIYGTSLPKPPYTVAHMCHTQTKRQLTHNKSHGTLAKTTQHANKSHGTKAKGHGTKAKGHGTKAKATAQKKKIGTHSIHVGILSEVTTDILYDFYLND